VRPIDREWHEQRQRAREQAFNSSLDIFSDEEIVKYELEAARIDGSDNPRTYILNRTLDLFGTNGTDIRELRDR
jgi:hypothetical protein